MSDKPIPLIDINADDINDFLLNRNKELETQLTAATARADSAVELRKQDLAFWQGQCELRESALKAAEAMLNRLDPYVDHKIECPGYVDNNLGCTCGLKQALEQTT